MQVDLVQPVLLATCACLLVLIWLQSRSMRPGVSRGPGKWLWPARLRREEGGMRGREGQMGKWEMSSSAIAFTRMGQ